MPALARLWFSFLHNCVAHPLLFWTADARWAVNFHDWSSRKMHDRYPKLYVRREASNAELTRGEAVALNAGLEPGSPERSDV